MTTKYTSVPINNSCKLIHTHTSLTLSPTFPEAYVPPPPTTTEAPSVLDNWTVEEDDRGQSHRKKGRRNRARNRNKNNNNNKYDVRLTTADSRFTQPPYVFTVDEEEYDEFGEKIVKNSQKQKSGRNGAAGRFTVSIVGHLGLLMTHVVLGSLRAL